MRLGDVIMCERHLISVCRGGQGRGIENAANSRHQVKRYSCVFAAVRRLLFACVVYGRAAEKLGSRLA